MKIRPIPAPARPPAPAELVQAAHAVLEWEHRVAKLTTSIRDAADPGAMPFARAEVAALLARLDTVTSLGLRVAGPGGSYSRWTTANDGGATFAANLTGVRDALTATGGLLASGDHVAAYRASTLASIAAAAVAQDLGHLHENRHHDSATSWASITLEQYDQNDDGVISLGADLARNVLTGESVTDPSSGYGMVWDNHRLFEAADAHGNHDTSVDLGELTALVAQFDHDRDAWLDIREIERIGSSYPVWHGYPKGAAPAAPATLPGLAKSG